MLDLKFVRQNKELIEDSLRRRNLNRSLDSFMEIDEKRRAALGKMEEMKAKNNAVSKEVGQRKKTGAATDDLMAEMKQLKGSIKEAEEEVRTLEEALKNELLYIPNVPHESVPTGKDDRDNQEVRRWGEPKNFDFEPLPHWEIGENLKILDAERAGKVTGTRFTFYRGKGAKLERAIINFFLDIHTRQHGYEEVFPPFMANSASMTGTGQLPKFAEDMFHVEGTDYYLIPTAEVPVTNFYRDEILDNKVLPQYFTAYSACFRAEAGAAGRDTRGLIRQHQFNKVELVKFVRPEDSYAELEKLTGNAERVLQLLNLPYRVVTLASGDLGFSSAKTYDIEVWLPSFHCYREISSCSNFEDFQARRANIRFRRDAKSKPEFVHTLNGSGVAIGRTVAAVLENYQTKDGNVKIPQVLRPYMGGAEYLGAEE
ncbi:MAG TPA: serine--tRNA ligase [Clostridiales bacterium]|nr:serine--tRNA ligase [Clostridiales bacterium]